MTEIVKEAREGNSSAEAAPEPNARTRVDVRARSIANFPLPPLALVTQRARSWIAQAEGRLDRAGSLVHHQPATFRQSHQRHHQAAGHISVPVLRWPRLAWGYLHLLVIKPVLHLAEWVTDSPARFLTAAAVLFIIWHWI